MRSKPNFGDSDKSNDADADAGQRQAVNEPENSALAPESLAQFGLCRQPIRT